MSQQLKYTVDIVLCIDATGSMQPVIEKVKNGALNFYQDLTKKMTDVGKVIDTLRVKVIVFRDFFADGDKAFKESVFFNLPGANTEFSTFINSITAEGGGDDPENGLEAIAAAVKSSWNRQGNKTRQVIVMWTDTTAHRLEKGAISGLSTYPNNLPKNLDELTDMWANENVIDQNGKRLILYTPADYPWHIIQENWDFSLHFPSIAGQGLSEVEYSAILDTIANSL